MKKSFLFFCLSLVAIGANSMNFEKPLKKELNHNTKLHKKIIEFVPVKINKVTISYAETFESGESQNLDIELTSGGSTNVNGCSSFTFKGLKIEGNTGVISVVIKASAKGKILFQKKNISLKSETKIIGDNASPLGGGVLQILENNKVVFSHEFTMSGCN